MHHLTRSKRYTVWVIGGMHSNLKRKHRGSFRGIFVLHAAWNPEFHLVMLVGGYMLDIARAV